MEIVIERAKQCDAIDGRTCNSGSNASGGQGSMCRASEVPAFESDERPQLPLAD